MSQKKYDAATLIIKKLKGQTFMTYKEIAQITGYHPKYISKLKKEILNREIKVQHGNKFKKPANTISSKEEQYICELYKRSHASIRAFSRFYSKRSYACIYNVLKKNGLINVTPKKEVDEKRKISVKS